MSALRLPAITLGTAAVAAAALAVTTGMSGAQAAQPAPAAVSSVARTTTAPRTFDVPGLDRGVVSAYNKFISVNSMGHFVAKIPADRFFTDAKGAWAATNAVTRANFLIDKQRMTLMANGASLQQAMGHRAVVDGTASQVLPMGEHATFQASWWGMTFTLDKVAADQLNAGLDKTQDVSQLLALLSSVGVVIAPEVTAVVGAVLAVVAVAATAAKANTTEDGLVIKSLWIPVPWFEKPAGPFTPAPAPTPNDPTPAPVPDPNVPGGGPIVVG